MVGKRAPTHDRLWAKIEKSAPEACWEWKGTVNNKGYGMLWSPEHNRKALSHRLVCEEAHGPIPAGSMVLHSCDNPRCCNPSHLRLGTAKENVADMDARARRVPPRLKGATNPWSKMTDASVTQLRCDYLNGVSLDDLSAKYGVSVLSIPDYLSGKSWRHLFNVPGHPSLADLRAERTRRVKSNARLAQADADEIRRRFAAGELGKDLATEFGVHKATVSDIVKNKTWV